MIEKKDFIQAIEEVKSVYKYQDDLNAFFKKHGVEGSIYQPDCATTVLRILHIIFGESDIDDWISYFCIDLDFGKKYKPGCVTDENGKDIVLETPEDLYNYLKVVNNN